VYSTSLKSVSSDKTRIERAFEAKSVQEMKSIKNRDLTVGGPNLAAQAFEAGLIDECQLFVTTVALGGGKSALPKGVHSDLELLNEVRFRSGVIYLHYRVR
jgi:dihydrofolate reductase